MSLSPSCQNSRDSRNLGVNGRHVEAANITPIPAPENHTGLYREKLRWIASVLFNAVTVE